MKITATLDNKIWQVLEKKNSKKFLELKIIFTDDYLDIEDFTIEYKILEGEIELIRQEDVVDFLHNDFPNNYFSGNTLVKFLQDGHTYTIIFNAKYKKEVFSTEKIFIFREKDSDEIFYNWTPGVPYPSDENLYGWDQEKNQWVLAEQTKPETLTME